MFHDTLNIFYRLRVLHSYELLKNEEKLLDVPADAIEIDPTAR